MFVSIQIINISIAFSYLILTINQVFLYLASFIILECHHPFYLSVSKRPLHSIHTSSILPKSCNISLKKEILLLKPELFFKLYNPKCMHIIRSRYIFSAEHFTPCQHKHHEGSVCQHSHSCIFKANEGLSLTSSRHAHV